MYLSKFPIPNRRNSNYEKNVSSRLSLLTPLSSSCGNKLFPNPARMRCETVVTQHVLASEISDRLIWLMKSLHNEVFTVIIINKTTTIFIHLHLLRVKFSLHSWTFKILGNMVITRPLAVSFLITTAFTSIWWVSVITKPVEWVWASCHLDLRSFHPKRARFIV